VGEAGFGQPRERLEAVRVERRTEGDILLDEGVQCEALEVGDHRHPKAPGHTAPLIQRDHDKSRLPPPVS
jgi:hypothetical protein